MKKDKNTGVIVEFAKNKHGVTIKKCCASCATHEPKDKEGPKRICTNKDRLRTGKREIVNRFDCCSFWSISKAMNNIKTNGHGL